jgi:energy-coupling factor transporter ATP-binding protein EcfA2
MKMRSVELTNFRKFVGTVRVDTIGDNVNVLVGRNELGKSTLLQAINGVIFEKARSTASHVKAFRHFVNGATKRDLSHASALHGVEPKEGFSYEIRSGHCCLNPPSDDRARSLSRRICKATGLQKHCKRDSPEQPFKGHIGRTVKQSTKDFPQEVKAPKDAPNILLILTDDVGFGASSTFGGPVPTPTMDRLANEGLRYTQFHTTALVIGRRGGKSLAMALAAVYLAAFSRRRFLAAWSRRTRRTR